MAKNEANLIIKIKEMGSEALSKVSAGLEAIGKAGVAAFTAISGIAAIAIKNYKEQELAVNKLNQSLVNQGIYTAETSKQYQDLATKLQAVTTFGDEQIIQAQATIQTFIGQNKVTKELTTAILNLASAKGIDLVTAAEMVGKTVSTGTNALARQGIQMELNGNTTQRLSQVTEVLNQKFGGQAEAAAKGMGSIDRLKNTVSDLFEVMGESLVPIVEFFTQRLSEMTTAVGASQNAMSGFADITKFMAEMVIVIHGLFEGLASLIGGTLGTAIGAVTQLMQGNFKQAYETIKSATSDFGDGLSNRWSSIQKNLDDLDQQYIDSKQAKLEQEEQMVNNSLANQGAAKEAFRQQEANLEQIDLEAKRAKQAEQDQIEKDMFQVKSEEELMRMQVHNQILASEADRARLEELNKQIADNSNKEKQIAAHHAKRKMIEDAYDAERRKSMTLADQFDAMMQDKRFQRANQTMSDLARMQDSKSRELVAIGKAAATAQVITDTARAVMGIQGWANAIPFVGPAIAAGLSAAVIAYGAEQISRIHGAQMAEGGIVTSRPGGMLATIGEGGRDEAVIPLEDGFPKGMGSNITIVVNGGLLGDEAQARELAVALDKEMLKLRRSNQSLAFDSSII